MTVSTIKMTARQFLMLGEDPPDVRLELAKGEVAVRPGPTRDHQEVVLALAAILRHHVKTRRLGRVIGDVDTVLGQFEVRRPDLFYFSNARLHLIGKTSVEGPPDLCVEVLSPGSRRTDREDKFALYRDRGVLHYWIIDPGRQTAEGYHLADGQYVLAGRGEKDDVVAFPPFDELKIPLRRLWRPKR